MDEDTRREPGTILIEVTATGRDERPGEGAYRGSRLNQVKAFSADQVAEALGVVRMLAGQTRAMVADLQATPGHDDLSNVEVAFGLTFNGELQAYVAKASGEASMTVKLTWEPKLG